MNLDQIKQEIKSCLNIEESTGFLYFLQNYVVVPHPTRGAVPLKDNIYGWQKQASVDFLKHKMFIFLKRRQVSATTLTIAYFLWRCLFFQNTEAVIVSLTQRDSADVLKRVKFMYDNLPNWLKTPKEEDAKTSIQFSNASRIKALPFKEDVLRGQSPSVVLIDEGAYMEPYMQNLLASAAPALGMGLLTPFSKDSIPGQLFLVSTLPLFNADGNTYFQKLRYAQENPNDSEYKVIDVDVSDIPEYNSEQWHKIQLESLGEHRYNVEVLAKLNEFTTNTFIATEILKNLTHTMPIRMDFLKPESVTEDGFSINHGEFHDSKDDYDESFDYMRGLWIFHDPIPDVEYGIAADVSNGTGGDFSAFHVFNLMTGEQVAEYRNNKINTEYYKQIILKVANYYNEASICIENNSMGGPLCEWFVTTLNYPKFYMHKISKKRFTPGLPVMSQRPNVVASLSQALSTKPPAIKLNSMRVINELKFFGYNDKTGKIEGVNKSKDDLVMALAQFTYVRDIGFFVATKQSVPFLDEATIRKIEKKEEDSKRLAWFKENFQVDSERDSDLLDYLSEGYAIAGGNTDRHDKRKQQSN